MHKNKTDHLFGAWYSFYHADRSTSYAGKPAMQSSMSREGTVLGIEIIAPGVQRPK
jgi:hypothetical protein